MGWKLCDVPVQSAGLGFGVAMDFRQAPQEQTAGQNAGKKSGTRVKDGEEVMKASRKHNSKREVDMLRKEGRQRNAK